MKKSTSHKILAFILAFIMIGSVLSVLAPSSPSTRGREIKKEVAFENYKDAFRIIPPNIAIFQYVKTDNIKNTDLELWLIQNKLISSQDVRAAMVVDFYNGLWVELVNNNRSEIKYSYSRVVEYGNYSLKDNNGIVLADEVSPYVYGPQPVVEYVLDLMEDGNLTNAYSEIYEKYNLSILGDNYDYVQIRAGNVTNGSDLLFVGIRYTGDGLYERISAYHLSEENVILLDTGNKTRFLEYNLTYVDDFRVKRVVGDFKSVIEDPL
jgi:hypothetical protein